MNYLFDSSAPKKVANLTINSDLLAQARSLGINLSALLEQALANEVRVRQGEAWLGKNSGAIEAYNRDVVEFGTFGDALTGF